MSIVITNPIANIPMNVKSHTLGWAKAWATRLNADINHKCTSSILSYDSVAIDHGVNFSGSLNMFGGADQRVFDNIETLLRHTDIISLDHDMPDYGAIFKKRLDAKSTYKDITEEWCDKVSERIATIPTIKQEQYDSSLDGVTLGDSHSIAFSRPTDRILRNDGATLYGALKTGLSNMFRGQTPNGNITLSFGSIDIRHHILRNNTDIPNLIREYIKQGSGLEHKYHCTVSYAAPVPVEYEGRKLPKTGYYKGTSFFGSAKDRARATAEFMYHLKDQGAHVIMPPSDWYLMDGEDYAKTHMEVGGSVHIAPPFYRRNDWGQ